VIPRFRSLFLLTLVLSAAASFGPALAQTAILPVAVDVEGKHITLAPADADAFQRRLNQPPLLDDPPPFDGPSYTVTTAYWDPAVREEEDEPAVEPAAEYFPAGGFVRARQDGKDVWLVLDLRQRAILDHYVGYGTRQGLPSDPVLRQAALNPSALLIAFLGYYGQGESIAIEVGDRLLTADEAEAFLASVAPGLYGVTFLDPPQPPRRGASGYWVRLTLPEGRALSYFLDTSAHTLTDSLGTESYDLSSAAGGGIPDSAEVLLIEDESPVGSQLWWLLAVGGGVSLLALAFALRRRQPP
jgi:hypothetical protein